MAVLENITQIAKRTIDIVMPPQCLMCHDHVADIDALCATCWSQLSFISAPLCDRYGTPFAYDPGDGILSAKALASPPSWNRARAVVQFDDHSRRLIHGLKYYDRHYHTKMMVRMMMLAGKELFEGADVILPVPLYRYRLWQRRYNQAALLAHRLAEMTEIPSHMNFLERTRPTSTQVGLDHKQRRKNVRNAFSLTPEGKIMIGGRNVLLVDDVLTTGATLDECTRSLMKAGAARVDVIVFALVLNPTARHI